jgi:hypothetical protein
MHRAEAMSGTAKHQGGAQSSLPEGIVTEPHRLHHLSQ